MQKTHYYKSVISGFSLDEVFVASYYYADMQRKVHRFKFVHNRVDRVYFESLFAHLQKEFPPMGTVIVHPPVSMKDRILRGPNHAQYLARYFLSAHNTYPLHPHDVSTPLKGGLGNEAPGAHAVNSLQSPFQGGEKVRGDIGGMGMEAADPFSVLEEIQNERSGYGYYTHPVNVKLTGYAGQMSRQMTRAEQRLWFEILEGKKTGYKWTKQRIIGNFIVDFYCHEKRLIIEVDGGVHMEKEQYDAARTKYLEDLGIRVLRFNNELVLGQTDEVRKMVMNELAKSESLNSDEASPQVPLLRGEKEENKNGGIEMGGESQTRQGSFGNIPIICPFQKKFFAGHQSKRSKQERSTIQEELFWNDKFTAKIRGKDIILVDDLITTGYTAHTLGKLLKEAGAKSVVGYFLASEKTYYEKNLGKDGLGV